MPKSQVQQRLFGIIPWWDGEYDGNADTARVWNKQGRDEKCGPPSACHATTDDTHTTTNDKCIHDVDDATEKDFTVKKTKREVLIVKLVMKNSWVKNSVHLFCYMIVL